MAMIKPKLLIFIFYVVALCNQTFAVHSNIQNAIDLRKVIELNTTDQLKYDTHHLKSVVLPVSRGFDQQRTCLCWSYAFFNALETMYLVKNPTGSLELSRGAIQYINIRDRIVDKINGTDDHVNSNEYSDCSMEGGIAADSANLIKKYGIVQYNDYHDIISPPKYTDIIASIFATDNINQQYTATESELANYFQQTIPTFTYFNEKFITAQEFGTALAGSGKWVSYAISSDGSEYQGKDPDRDARPGSVTNYTARDKVLKLILDNLDNNLPVLYSNIAHLVMIYGVDYDENMEPVKFYIKDNYARLGFYYQADVKKVLDELGEITVYEE